MLPASSSSRSAEATLVFSVIAVLARATTACASTRPLPRPVVASCVCTMAPLLAVRFTFAVLSAALSALVADRCAEVSVMLPPSSPAASERSPAVAASTVSASALMLPSCVVPAPAVIVSVPPEMLPDSAMLRTALTVTAPAALVWPPRVMSRSEVRLMVPASPVACTSAESSSTSRWPACSSMLSPAVSMVRIRLLSALVRWPCSCSTVPLSTARSPLALMRPLRCVAPPASILTLPP